MAVRGVRGAITAGENSTEAIHGATAQLLHDLFEANRMNAADVAAIFFTVTPDLDAAFPATAARKMGLDSVALFGSCELNPPGSVPRCIRVLILWNTERPQSSMRHVYLGGAATLRPEWVAGEGSK